MSDGDSSAVFYLPSDLFGGDDTLQSAISSTGVNRRNSSRSPTTSGTLLRATRVVSQECKNKMPRQCVIQKRKGTALDEDKFETIEHQFEPTTLLRQSKERKRSPEQSSPAYKSHDGQSSGVRPRHSHQIQKSARGPADSPHLTSCRNLGELNTDLIAIPCGGDSRASLESKKTHSVFRPPSPMTPTYPSAGLYTLSSRINDNFLSVGYAPVRATSDDAEITCSGYTPAAMDLQVEHAPQRYSFATSAVSNTEGDAEKEGKRDMPLMNVTLEDVCGSSSGGLNAQGRATLRRNDNLQVKNHAMKNHSDILSPAQTAGVESEGRENTHVHGRHLNHDDTHCTTPGIRILPLSVSAQTQNTLQDTHARPSRTAVSLPLEYQLFLKETQELITRVQRGGLGSSLFPFSKDDNEDPDICSLTRRRVVIHEENWGTRCVNDVMLACINDALSTVEFPRRVRQRTTNENSSCSRNLSAQGAGSPRDGTVCGRQRMNPWAAFLNAASQEHLREGLRPLSSIEWSAAVAIAMHIYSKKILEAPQPRMHMQMEDEAEIRRGDLFSSSRHNEFQRTTTNHDQRPCGAGAAFSSSSPIVLSELTR